MAPAGQEPLAVLYFHRPPLYISQGPGQGGGLLLDRVKRVLGLAEVPFALKEMPVKRILEELKWGKYACGIGWFKTAEREAYVTYSDPIYQDGPYQILINRRKAAGLPVSPTLEQVLKSGLTMGSVAGYTYGAWAEGLLERLRPPRENPTGSTINLLRMIALGRCDFTLAAPDEAAWLLAQEPELSARLEARPLAGASPGNQRHILLSKAVPAEVVRRVNLAIARVVAEEGLTPGDQASQPLGLGSNRSTMSLSLH